MSRDRHVAGGHVTTGARGTDVCVRHPPAGGFLIEFGSRGEPGADSARVGRGRMLSKKYRFCNIDKMLVGPIEEQGESGGEWCWW